MRIWQNFRAASCHCHLCRHARRNFGCLPYFGAIWLLTNFDKHRYLCLSLRASVVPCTSICSALGLTVKIFRTYLNLEAQFHGQVSLTSRAKNWRVWFSDSEVVRHLNACLIVFGLLHAAQKRNAQVVVQQTGAFLASQSAPAPAPTLAPTETAPPAPPAPAPAAAPVAVPDASQPTAAAVAPTAEPQAASCHIAVGIQDGSAVKLAS